MNFLRLGDIIEITKGQKVTNVGNQSATYRFRYIQAEDLRHNENIKFTDEGTLVEVNNNDLVILWDGANAGTIGQRLTGIIGSTLARLRIKDTTRTDPQFLRYFLQSDPDLLKRKTTGGSLPHVDRSSLEDLKVPELEPGIQQQIITVLDKTQFIIEKRKITLQLIDQLLMGAFFDMFGDPLSNPKGWKLMKLTEIATLIRSGSILKEGNDIFTGSGPYFIRAQNVMMNRVDLEKAYHINEKAHSARNESWVMNNDVLMNVSTAGVGRVALYDGEDGRASVSQQICIIRPSTDEVYAEYLTFLMGTDSYQRRIKGIHSGISRDMIDVQKISELEIPVAGLKEQERFVKLYNVLKGIRSKATQSHSRSEILFRSLLQKAFTEEGIQVQQTVSEEDTVMRSIAWLKEQANYLPYTAAGDSFRDRVDKLLTGLYEDPEKNLKSSAVKELSGLSTVLKQQFQEQNISSFAAINTREAADMLLPEKLRNSPAAGRLHNILYSFGGNEEKAKRKEEQTFQSDSRYRYIKESGLGDVTIGGIKMDLLEMIYRHYQNTDFSSWGLDQLIQDEKQVSPDKETAQEAFFEILDRFICAEFWDQPFSFPQLQDALKELRIVPDFESLTNYVISREEKEPAFLRQLYNDDKVSTQSPVAAAYFSESAQQGRTIPRRIYLKLYNLKATSS